MNEERRKSIAKDIKKHGEESKVAIRKVRQDINTKIKNLEKSKELNKDESNDLQKEVQKHTDNFIKIVSDKVSAKEKEILSL